MATGHEHWGAEATAEKTSRFLESRLFGGQWHHRHRDRLKNGDSIANAVGYMASVTQFACLEGGYHGETIATLAVGDCDSTAKPYRPLMFPSVRVGNLPLRYGPDDTNWLDASAEWPAIEAQLATHAQTLAAIVYEPVLQGAGGMRLISPDLLAAPAPLGRYPWRIADRR